MTKQEEEKADQEGRVADATQAPKLAPLAELQEVEARTVTEKVRSGWQSVEWPRHESLYICGCPEVLCAQPPRV